MCLQAANKPIRATCTSQGQAPGKPAGPPALPPAPMREALPLAWGAFWLPTIPKPTF